MRLKRSIAIKPESPPPQEPRVLVRGMTSNRRCTACGNLLLPNDGEKCGECRPQLSARAQRIGNARRRERERLDALEREVDQLKILIRKIERAIDVAERHGGHPREIA